MHNSMASFSSLGMLLLLAIMACNLPSATLPPSASPEKVPSAVSLTVVLSPMTSPAATASLVSPSATNTSAPTISPTPQNPLVTVDSLCWGGPGKAYEVISTIRSNTRVVLLGRGIVDGWWVVKNPTYRDPCWLPVANLQIDPAMDLSGFPVYRVPPTPTP